MRLFSLLCLASASSLLLLGSARAYADTLSLSVVLDQHARITGGISGSLTLNPDGLITGSDFRAGTNRGGFQFSNAPTSQNVSNGITELVFLSDQGGAVFDLDLPTTNLDQLGSVQVCSIQNSCAGSTISDFSLQGRDSAVDFGSVSGPSSPTPEPSALLLIGTGLSGTAYALRRRVHRPTA